MKLRYLAAAVLASTALVVTVAGPATASTAHYATVTSSGCDAATGTQWVTWAPNVQGGLEQPLGDGFHMHQAWVADDTDVFVEVSSSMTYTYDDPTMTVTGIPGDATTLAVILLDDEGHDAILDADPLPGGCVQTGEATITKRIIGADGVDVGAFDIAVSCGHDVHTVSVGRDQTASVAVPLDTECTVAEVDPRGATDTYTVDGTAGRTFVVTAQDAETVVEVTNTFAAKPVTPAGPAVPTSPAEPAAPATAPLTPPSGGVAAPTPANVTAATPPAATAVAARLASTGTELPVPLAAGAALLVALGAGLIVLRRRRTESR